MNVLGNVINSFKSLPADIQACQRAQVNQRPNAPTDLKTKGVGLKILSGGLFLAAAPFLVSAVVSSSLPALFFGGVLLVLGHDTAVVGHNILHPNWSTGARVGLAALREAPRFMGLSRPRSREEEEVDMWRSFCTNTLVADALVSALSK